MAGNAGSNIGAIQDFTSMIAGDPTFDDEATGLVINNLNSSATAIAASQGVDPLSLGATEAIVAVLVVDRSGSMEDVAESVLLGLKDFVKASVDSKQSPAVTLTIILFNTQVVVLFANKPIESIDVERDIQYYATGGTALYDAVADGLDGAMVYEDQLAQTGMQTKGVVIVLSDGADNSSRRADADKIRARVEQLRKRESWVVQFVGFKTGEGVDFKDVATKMGIRQVITFDASGTDHDRQHAIREGLGFASRSLISQSQTTVVPGGPDPFFGAP